MRKRYLVIMILVLIIAALVVFGSGCNVQVVDTHWNFDRAIIKLPNGDVVEGRCQSWTDFEDGDQLQVKVDGKTYLTHASNVVLIDD